MKAALTLQQFRGACAVVDCGFNVSRAADALHTTQSAVSKTIKGLEEDLGAAIFLRSSVRMIGLTDYGQDFIDLARGILRDTERTVTLAQREIKGTKGVFKIGTTHLHARYSLPRVIQAFRSRFPEVSIELEQGHPDEIPRWVAARRVHMGITTVAGSAPAGLATLPAMTLERCIVVPRGHALVSIDKPTVAQLAPHDFVCYPEPHPIGAEVRQLFRKSGTDAAIVVCGADATVLKEYVAAGVGIAILQRIVIGPEDTARLDTIDASHLIPPTEPQLLFRRGEYLRSYVYDFIDAFAPRWTRRSAIDELERQAVPGNAGDCGIEVTAPRFTARA